MQLGNGWFEVLELLALFLLKEQTCAGAKKIESFSLIYYIYFDLLRFVSKSKAQILGTFDE